MMKFIFIPHIANFVAPLLFALILTFLMRKYRKPEYVNESGDYVFYAPLIRRAFAELIDIIIVLLLFYLWVRYSHDLCLFFS